MEKKGQQSFSYLMWILRIIYLCVVITAIVLVIRVYTTQELKTDELEATIFINRIMQSPNGISYYDYALERVDIGVVDARKFNEDNLARSMNYGEENKYLAARIDVMFDNGENKTIKYNSEWYDRWIVRAQTRAKGEGSAVVVQRMLNVLYLEDGKQTPVKLLFTVVMPNE